MIPSHLFKIAGDIFKELPPYKRSYIGFKKRLKPIEAISKCNKNNLKTINNEKEM